MIAVDIPGRGMLNLRNKVLDMLSNPKRMVATLRG